MLALTRIQGARVLTEDEDRGTIKDLLFDDRNSAVRYVVVDIGSWLKGKKILLAPGALGALADLDNETIFDSSLQIRTALTKSQLESCPTIETHRPVSKQDEESFDLHFRGQQDWGKPPADKQGPAWFAGIAAPSMSPKPTGSAAEAELQDLAQQNDDPHLRSAHEIMGYSVEARGGVVGHVDNLLISLDGWFVGAIVIDTGTLFAGRKAVVPTTLLGEVRFDKRTIGLSADTSTIEEAPEYDEKALLHAA